MEKPETYSTRVIKRLGGPKKVAKLCQCTVQAISQWQGYDADGKERVIPPARLLHLKAVRSKVFAAITKEDEEAGVPL